MTEVLPRITEILRWSQLGPAAFADEIGVARAVISHILSARNKASLEVVQKILSRFTEVSPQWLLLGQGEMLKELDRDSLQIKQEYDHVSPVGGALEVAQEVDNIQKVESPKATPSTLVQEPQRHLVKVILLYSDGKYESYNPS
ncbi:XRE family transcriptional regulator [Rufibacter immobilis]|uniref:XRE family transcriptional regulator n=1 Tax=Rufibacter immobilis TaxID=1348778 RepID=A0A3M9MQR0_9BACT|nr:helix-turn-helix transcriptional regulator [Rufibacter immobilis]RNI27850.1 XRE family transcriptional regulator [Rufibacter immobilis]